MASIVLCSELLETLEPADSMPPDDMPVNTVSDMLVDRT
jgi:hypothetical protein